jgi:KaiC/GvpD/RAD55 family RecA-like ATPase
MDRVKTGIPGFDPLLKGGFPRGSIILLSGTPATGKTIFSVQYLYNGIVDHNEPGLFVTFEEKAEKIIEQASLFGWDLAKLQKNRTLTLMHIAAEDINYNTVSKIIDTARAVHAKRLVIDNMNILALNVPNIASDFKNIGKHAMKRFVYNFIAKARSLDDVTTILISQTTNETALSSDEVSEFLCDGIIHIAYESLGGKYSRSLLVRKMRQIENDEDIHPLEIGKKGIVIHTIR